MHGSTLPAPAFRPVGLYLCGLVGILERLVEVLERRIRSRTVGIQDMVSRVDSNRFREFLTVS